MTFVDTNRKITAILDAFYALLQRVGAVDAKTIVRREGIEGEALDASNTVIVDFWRGGMSAEPVPRMNGDWDVFWTARIRIVVNGTDAGADRSSRLDGIADAISALVPVPDAETLDGLVDLVEVQDMQEPNPELLGGAVGVYDAEIPVLFLYTAPTRAG